MFAIAALLDPRQDPLAAPVVQLIGAGPLAELMAAARIELGRERASSRRADVSNSALAGGSAPPARVERLR